ncbi:hypothetical protein QYE76_024540 [Lolium multiflorum]|uniref:Uncharacterized protein n=1 Tax=Lolium multiflorum TaxID=4521 RepID=A0AAD8VW63_LOLMU|nr:hypothetical protein QYE76_024540 [Lolium multiflorum]
MPKLKSSEGSHVAYGTDSRKDIFFWGDVLGSVLDHGDASKANVSLPRLLNSTQILEVQNVACGEEHAAIVTKQGEVFSWGKESGDRLGHKVGVGVSHPKIIDSLAFTPVKTIAFGAKHTCALAVSGELYEWGEGAHSLCLGDDQCHRSQWFPHKLYDPLDGISVLKISCGQWHTAIISSSGQLFTYGDGTFGVLGHGDTKSVARPKEVESLKGVRAKAVACGPWHTAAIVEILGNVKSNAPSGKLFTWGDAERGKLGHADDKMKLVPTCVKPLTDVDFAQVSCAKTLTVALTITGVVFTIGSKQHGKLGINHQTDDASICTVEGPLKTEFVREISAGSSHVAVLTMNGRVYTWGKGTEGQLGLGDYADRSISGKDQSVCRSCGLSFSFTRKKHHCYNCGSMFCNSCSSNKRMPESVPSKYTSSFPQAASNLKAESDSAEKILLREVKQLQAQVTTLAEQCRHRSLKVQSYKRKVDETWLTVRNEAAKSKTAKDIIKVLTNQRNALSKKISAGQQSYNFETIPSRITSGVKAELPDPPDETPVTVKSKPSGIRDHHEQLGRECIHSKNTATINDSTVRRNGRKEPNNSYIYAGETVATVHPIDSYGTVEQISRGVYVTIVTSPGGNKGLKRIRFSRKHFVEKEAQKWWEANKSRLFAKYSSMEQLTE